MEAKDRIVTVSGEIAPPELGFCQSHEHLCVDCDWIRQTAPALTIDDPALTLTEVLRYREGGGAALVDAQPLGAGRNAEVLRFLAEGSGVRIIASTGFHRMLYYPEGHWIFEWSEDQLAGAFIAELREGMYLGADTRPPAERSDIRAGQIKAALEPGPMDAQYEKLWRAAAQAAARTGAPLMAHIERDADPLALADWLEKRGVSPAQMIFCHLDRAIDDLSVHTALLERGVTLEYDTIARPRYHDDDREIEILRRMVEAGHQDRLLAGLDVTRARLTAYGGAPGLSYIRDVFIEKLLQAGFPAQVIDQIFLHNPARAFRGIPI